MEQLKQVRPRIYPLYYPHNWVLPTFLPASVSSHTQAFDRAIGFQALKNVPNHIDAHPRTSVPEVAYREIRKKAKTSVSKTPIVTTARIHRRIRLTLRSLAIVCPRCFSRIPLSVIPGNNLVLPGSIIGYNPRIKRELEVRDRVRIFPGRQQFPRSSE